jgi:hypothetical protein
MNDMSERESVTESSVTWRMDRVLMDGMKRKMTDVSRIP